MMTLPTFEFHRQNPKARAEHFPILGEFRYASQDMLGLRWVGGLGGLEHEPVRHTELEGLGWRSSLPIGSRRDSGRL